ncbi:hypothetical protein F0562_024214 [Nyssa sinensis]|uniref:Uncharacterized protein n=1 Tax=Nyssa sinensis TaxID=561372 RepID=A0A5J5BAN3_9ASTE|nr:hypothetical protein F0562_024214 [Nyssa sinensis]
MRHLHHRERSLIVSWLLSQGKQNEDGNVPAMQSYGDVLRLRQFGHSITPACFAAELLYQLSMQQNFYPSLHGLTSLIFVSSPLLLALCASSLRFGQTENFV